MAHTHDDFQRVFKAARRSATPLLAIRTADPMSALDQVEAGLPKQAETPVLSWDILRGLTARNEPGKAAVRDVAGDHPETLGPAELLGALYKAARAGERNAFTDAVVFVNNPHRLWEQVDILQGIWNLRDVFKAGGQTLILVTTPGAVLPVELQSDVMVIDQPLPAAPDLETLVRETFESAELPLPDDAAVTSAVDALIGLATFPAEQVLAMSLSKKGLDVEQLWERKRQAVEQAPGLDIWRGGETFADVGGCANIKQFLRAVVNGKEAPRVVVFVDEIEKAFAGTGTDLSGVKTEMTGTMLTWMQDRGADGSLLLGPPGCAKSMIGKAAGNTAGIPTIAFDLAAMQSSLVGGSGERLRSALQVVDAISQGRSLWIATCNSITSLPPELRRRFTLGTFFFDLPDAEEREAIWRIYLDKWQVEDRDRSSDDGWTGAEIKECVRKAWRLGLSLKESANYIVPVAKSAADQIESLRRQASGRFLSASRSGVYTADAKPELVGLGKRALRDLE